MKGKTMPAFSNITLGELTECPDQSCELVIAQLLIIRQLIKTKQEPRAERLQKQLIYDPTQGALRFYGDELTPTRVLTKPVT
jgi:hypothetical protein